MLPEGLDAPNVVRGLSHGILVAREGVEVDMAVEAHAAQPAEELEGEEELQGLREQLERVMARFASQPAERESGRADGADGTGGGASSDGKAKGKGKKGKKGRGGRT